MPGGHRTDITFTGRGCPSSGHFYYSPRPIWVDFVAALLLLEFLREIILAVKGWYRRRQCAARSSENCRSPRTGSRPATRAPPPSEQLLPGESPSDLYGPSAPPLSSDRDRARRPRNPDDRTRGLPRPGDTFHDAGELIPVQYVPARELIVGPDSDGNPTCVHRRHKLSLGDVHRLVITWNRPPPINLDP